MVNSGLPGRRIGSVDEAAMSNTAAGPRHTGVGMRGSMTFDLLGKEWTAHDTGPQHYLPSRIPRPSVDMFSTRAIQLSGAWPSLPSLP